MKEGSMLEAAYRILLANGTDMKFPDLWAKIKEELDISAEEEKQRIGRFYTDLSLSGQFVVVVDNRWDLRSRHTYDKVHIDIGAVYSEVEESDNDVVDQAEEEEYNASIRGGVVPSDEGGSEGEEDESQPKPEANASELLGMQNDNY